jgi:hypothetical protein
MPRLRYADIAATLAVVISLGGTAYAAVKITGRDVVDGSLTGADIKKRSIPANRIKGGLPRGAAGPAGATGATGATGPAGATGPKGDTGTPDSSQFFTKAEADARYRGETVVSVWPHNFDLFAGLNRSKFSDSAQVTVSGTGTNGFVVYPDTPVSTDGRRMKLVGVDACYNAQSAGVSVSSVYLYVARFEPGDDPLDPDIVGQQTFTPAADGSGCFRLDYTTPVTLESTDAVRAGLTANFTQTGINGVLGLGRWAFVFTTA